MEDSNREGVSVWGEETLPYQPHLLRTLQTHSPDRKDPHYKKEIVTQMPKKILVSCNILTEVDGQAYPSHIVNAFRMGRDTDCEFMFHSPRRMPIASARNSAVEAALAHNCDYIFFYDDDMELDVNTFKTLLSRDKDIIMALCYIRGYPFKPMVFKWIDGEEFATKIADTKIEGKAISLWGDCEESVSANGLIENVAAVGCAATLVKVDVFRKIDHPWFYTGTANTEDVYFCIKAQSKIPGVSIAVDTTVPAGHVLKDKHILYPANAKMLKRWAEEASTMKGREVPDGTEA